MILTVSNLLSILTQLQNEGHGRKPVVIDKSSLYNPNEADGCYIMGVHAVSDVRSLNSFDEDGFRFSTPQNKHNLSAIVLYGASGTPGKYERTMK